MSELLKMRSGGVTAAKGFVAGGFQCGIRKAKKDLAMIRSERPATVAAVFTKNLTQAACIQVDKEQLRVSEICSVIVVNSGNANACTGDQGLRDARSMVQSTADAFGLSAEQVLVSSTGVIGQYLPMEKVTTGIHTLSRQLSEGGNTDAAQAIMTTDTYPKEVAVGLELGGTAVTIGGMAKGSGMIAPNMATMLAFVTTDAAIDRKLLQEALRTSTNRSFNRITVDGDMSTNDMAVVLANGTAGNPLIMARSGDYDRFLEGLDHVLISLAKKIARDGEGATKLIEIIVSGSRSESEAVRAASAVANSNLVKTAIHGADANWGRILAAVGYSGIEFKPEMTEISFNDLPILQRNYRIVLDEGKASKALAAEEVMVHINLNQGTEKASFWTCDLTKEYVHINAGYRS